MVLGGVDIGDNAVMVDEWVGWISFGAEVCKCVRVYVCECVCERERERVDGETHE